MQDTAITRTTSVIAEYNPTEAALSQLRERFANVLFDVATPKGDKDARAARAEIKGYRVSLEKKRKEIKEPALERCRLIDAEAKRITAELLKLEAPIDDQIKLEEQRKATAEKARVEAIRHRIEAICRFVTEATGKKAVEISALRDRLISFEMKQGDFEEFLEDAKTVKRETLNQLHLLFEEAAQQEAEAARMKAEREELARLRLAQAERERQIAAAQEALRQEQVALLEQKRLQEAAQRKAEEAQRAQEEALKQNLAELEEQNRFAKEMARAQEEAERKAKQEAKRFQEAAHAQGHPSADEIIGMLSLHYNVHDLDVIQWLRKIDLDAAEARICQREGAMTRTRG